MIKKLFTKCKRVCRFYYMKAVREQGTPEYIARGWAIGMFIGLFIPFGLQLAISVPLAFLLKGSKLGSVVGTFLTNHFTIFIIYPFQCWLGNMIIGGKLSIAEIEQAMDLVVEKQDYKVLYNLGMEIVVSFFLGGLILALIITPICYYGVKYLVIRYRRISAEKKKIN
ncbi:MAG: DUF2062 domain-containing protein [Lentisphaeria bacterium]|nr:DUF2062 domain-containing protein [Lentisphaeria bacterium]